jgi:hypothetical protein
MSGMPKTSSSQKAADQEHAGEGARGVRAVSVAA